MEGAVDQLRESLEWAGLDYDEGVYFYALLRLVRLTNL